MEYERVRPKDERHSIHFTRDEVIEALVDFAKKHGRELPGPVHFLWGLDGDYNRKEEIGIGCDLPISYNDEQS